MSVPFQPQQWLLNVFVADQLRILLLKYAFRAMNPTQALFQQSVSSNSTLKLFTSSSFWMKMWYVGVTELTQSTSQCKILCKVERPFGENVALFSGYFRKSFQLSNSGHAPRLLMNVSKLFRFTGQFGLYPFQQYVIDGTLNNAITDAETSPFSSFFCSFWMTLLNRRNGPFHISTFNCTGVRGPLFLSSHVQ